MKPRGALLLEALIALAIFVMAGLAILGVMRQGSANLRDQRDRAQGLDIARSTLAQIESGIATPDTLDGPVRPWQGNRSAVAIDDAPPPETPWEVDIKTEPAGVADLSRVRVQVSKNKRMVAEMTQLIPLVARASAGVTP